MSQSLTVSYKIYGRDFSTPLKTAYGCWSRRKGILIRLESSEGTFAYGEIANIEDFGTEKFEESLEFCQSLDGSIDEADIFQIADTLPCCQFAFESAWMMLNSWNKRQIELECAALLSADSDLFLGLQKQANFRVFKIKIGSGVMEEEQAEVLQLLKKSPESYRFRLDANASLDFEQCKDWLEKLDAYSSKIEFMEQPLAVGLEEQMEELASRTKILFALDESLQKQSLGNFDSFWTGLYVVKPCLLGSPQKTREWIENKENRVIFSSSFETQIGEWAAFQILPKNKWALGWGTSKYFTDNFQTALNNSLLLPARIFRKSLEKTWMHIGNF